MDLNMITMDPAEADAAFRAYRAEFMKHRNQIDGELMRGYKEIAKGHKLISLQDAINTAGLNEQNLPAVAVNRADETDVWLDVSGTANEPRLTFYNGRNRHPIRLNAPDGCARKWNQRAVMPLIPPQYRPPFGLHNYHLLWEVDKWTQGNPQPRRDPALLKHIGGDLYAVLAVWDLTELEAKILGLLRQ